MKLTDDYQYESEKEKEQTSKKSDKKELPEKLKKTDVRESNELIIKRRNINEQGII